MPRVILLGLLTARSERLVLKSSGEHSKFKRDTPRHSGCSLRFPPPRASTCVLLSRASPGERADRERCRLLIQGKESLQQELGAIAGNEVAARSMHEVDLFSCWPSHCLWGGLAFSTYAVCKSDLPFKDTKMRSGLFSSPSIPAKHIRAQILKTKRYYYCCYFFMVEENINVTNSCH